MFGSLPGTDQGEPCFDIIQLLKNVQNKDIGKSCQAWVQIMTRSTVSKTRP